MIDFHTHAFPDFLAVKAIPSLAARSGLTPETDGTVASLIKRMDEWGVSRAVICNIATNPKQQENVNLFAEETNRLYGDRITALFSVHPAHPEAVLTLEKAAVKGIPGVKLHPDYMGYDFNDPIWDPILETCERLGLFIIIHAGFDSYSPNHMHATPEMIKRRLEAFPHLRLIAAHFGSHKEWERVEDLLIGTNVYFDVSLGGAHGLSAVQAKRMILRHNPDRILFGSDCPWGSAEKTFSFLHSLGLPEDLEKKILSENAKQLLCLS